MAHFVTSEVHKQYSPLFYPTTPDATKERFATKLASASSTSSKVLQAAVPHGGRFTIADAYLFTILNWSHHLKVDLSPYPGSCVPGSASRAPRPCSAQ